MDFDKMMSLVSVMGNDKKDMDIFSIMDMFMPAKNVEKSYNKHNLFDDKYEEHKNVKCLKSTVPYLQYNHQKNVLILLKIVEIMELINIYNTSERKKCESHDIFGMFEDMMPHLDEKKQSEIKKCMNIYSLKDRL